jgi:hypothetical protein
MFPMFASGGAEPHSIGSSNDYRLDVDCPLASSYFDVQLSHELATNFCSSLPFVILRILEFIVQNFLDQLPQLRASFVAPELFLELSIHNCLQFSTP